MTSKRKERRGALRRRARIRVRFWNDELEGTGYSSDISSKGLFVETRKLSAIGTRVHVELTLKDRPFFLECVIVRQRRSAHNLMLVVKSGIGLQLVSLHEVIRSLVSASEKSSSQSELRVDLSDPATLEKVYHSEISRAGVFVATEAKLARDQDVTLILVLPEPHGEYEVRGQVVHIMEQPVQGLGVKLIEPDQVRGKLSEIVDQGK